MAFIPIYLGSLMTLFCITSASDIPVSVVGKESNVTSVTSVFLPPSLSNQHSKDKLNHLRDSSTLALSDAPSSIEYHHMDEPSKLLDSMQQDYEKLKKEVEDKTASYEKARGEFESKKKEDEKELAKIGEITKEREEAERKLRDEEAQLNALIKQVDEEEKAVKKEEENIAELQKRHEAVETKNSELEKLLAKLAELEKAVVENLGECIDVPPKLKAIWGDSVHPNTKLCMKADA